MKDVHYTKKILHAYNIQKHTWHFTSNHVIGQVVIFFTICNNKTEDHALGRHGFYITFDATD